MEERELDYLLVNMELNYHNGTTRTLRRKASNFKHANNIYNKEMNEFGYEGLKSLEFVIVKFYKKELRRGEAR